MQISTIQFTNFGHRGTLTAKLITWNIKNNLDENGLSIEDAFINWEARNPNPFTAKSFCDYVKSKDPNIKCQIYKK